MPFPFSLQEPFQPRPKILLLGDSLTQLCFEGWGAHLANVYQRRADVINRGFAGYNTKFFLQLPDETVFDGVMMTKPKGGGGTTESSKCCLVIVWFGANDAGLPGLADHHYVSKADYQANLHQILDRVQDRTQTPCILLLTPPPVHHAQRLVFQKQKYGDKATGVLERTLENTSQYAAACATVARERNLPCCDLYTLMQQDAAWDTYLHDGLHFSTAGHKWLGETVVGAIAQHFPELAVTTDPRTGQYGNSASTCVAIAGNTDGPFHDEIDHTQVAQAFVQYQSRLSSDKDE